MHLNYLSWEKQSGRSSSMVKNADRKSQVYWDRTTRPPSLHRPYLLPHSLGLFTSTFKVVSLTALLQRKVTSISSLWEALHEGPERLTQYVWQGWLDTADTQEDPRTWTRYEPKMTEKNLETFCLRNVFLPRSWRHYLNATFTELDLEMQLFWQSVLSLQRHTQLNRQNTK